ncbi:hypothetical protein Y017_11395 [Alcanivorax sp. 97CO-5]|uniref:lysozyme inhibitor LprI family protein n=1 Tax=unclassified Alcanivorax TaxID=2638842 RepID=UPI0003E802E6|nr:MULTISPECIES: lysozyme inhibitor LprI family protein [unclassified Alcanivorax]EUC70214.1 hypothetical protein Y017_11395 [Alcanivorax sp. 97CO-5]PKG01801.1 DUF1311 domain-containing protein [Alcanivorax sp. 97CO-6]
MSIDLLEYQLEISSSIAVFLSVMIFAVAAIMKKSGQGLLVAVVAGGLAFLLAWFSIPDMYAKEMGFPNKKVYFQAKEDGYDDYKVYKEHLSCRDEQSNNVDFNKREKKRAAEIESARTRVLKSRSVVCSDLQDMIRAAAMSRYGSRALQYGMPYSCEYLPIEIELQSYEPTYYPNIIHVFTYAGDFFSGYSAIGEGFKKGAVTSFENRGFDYKSPIKYRKVDFDSCDLTNKIALKPGQGVLLSAAQIAEEKEPENERPEKNVDLREPPHIRDSASLDEYDRKIKSYTKECYGSGHCYNVKKIWERNINYYLGELKKKLPADIESILAASQEVWRNTQDSTYVAISHIAAENYPNEEGTLWMRMRSRDATEEMAKIERSRALTLKRWLDVASNNARTTKAEPLVDVGRSTVPLHVGDYKNPSVFDKAYNNYYQGCLQGGGEGCLDVYQIWDRELNYYYSELRSNLPEKLFTKLRASQRLSSKGKSKHFDAIAAILGPDAGKYVLLQEKTEIIKSRALMLYSILEMYNNRNNF